ncbi:transposable element Tcb1 transposase [Trichonephila clavipes]|uniref:Transposable element Tcb1 transposase n=1 Tax=Trichonephila clavipes TaxID=2585209 RepID=A0A8X6W4H5_TRICX|nr:transposable element Tcb1 transposase [Trichonephila clavipes]
MIENWVASISSLRNTALVVIASPVLPPPAIKVMSLLRPAVNALALPVALPPAINCRRKLNSSQILKQWTLTSNVSVCPRTVGGRLLEIGLRGCKARPKPLLTEFQRKRRLTGIREHSLWTIKDWEKVIFSDESQFCISGDQSSAYVRRRTHEEFSPQCLNPTVRYPTKVMVWGCMSSHGVGRLHIVSGTVKAMNYIEILQNKLLPTTRDLFGNQSWVFQDDNSPCHRAKVVQKWLKNHTVNKRN